ncbi:MAG: hypothetical protein K1W13_13055 [Lachnospiraceae bacterium]
MKRKIFFGLTVLFLGIMLAGTFFHQKIDSLFRPKVQIAVIEGGSEYVSFWRTVEGKETEYMREESYLLLPAQAVRDNTVYVLEHVTVPYGSYDIVTLRIVQTAGESNGKVKITEGLTGNERVAAVYEDAFYDGMRVVVEEKY